MPNFGAETHAMTGSFIANLAFLIFVNFLIKPAALLVDASVQNAVGAETYGMYTAIFNFSTLFYIILDLGITNYNNRSVAQDSAHLERYMPGILMLKVLLAVVYVGITYTAALLTGYPAEQLYLLLFMMLNQIMLSSILYFRSNISGLHYFRLDSVLSAMDKLLLLIMVSALLWAGFAPKPFNIRWFVYAQSISLGSTAAIAFFFVLSKAGKIRFKWTWADIGHLLRNTYPYALLGILMTLYYRIDTVMIERMLPTQGDYEAGVYAASFRFLDAANNVGLLFAALLLPMFARMLANKTPIDNLLITGFKLLFTGAMIVMGIAVVFRQPIVHLIYRQATDYWGDIFGMLFLAFGAVSIVYIYGSLLTANGSMKVLNWIALGGCVLNIALNWVLIPSHHAIGSAFATLVTQWVVALLHIVAAQRQFRLKNNWPLLLRLVGFALVLAGLGWLTNQLPVSYKLLLPAYILAATIVAVLLRLFDVQAAMALVRSRRGS